MTCSAVKKNVNILLTLKGKINIKKKKKKKTHENQESYGQCHWLQQTRTNSDLSKTVIRFKFRELLQ